ncbi:MAG: exosortase H [Phycisphaerales bacterium]|nr:exosortase H [Phycisphaerales bacterium]MCI0632078.1 exosortase H [Phycisphaerales bacterium]MCI0676368.1 exosortase H [Phycisphaerales bacterium]
MTSAPAKTAPPMHRKHAVLRFVGVFALIMAIFYALTATPWFRSSMFPGYLKLNAVVSASVLRLLGEDAQAHDTFIFSSRGGLAIRRGCDGIEPTAFLAAAIIAFPAPWRSRLLAVLLGASLLLLLNLVRIVSLFYVRALYPDAFQSIHVDFWQTAFVFIVMLIWILWAWRVTNTNPKAPSHAPA